MVTQHLIGINELHIAASSRHDARVKACELHPFMNRMAPIILIRFCGFGIDVQNTVRTAASQGHNGSKRGVEYG